MKRDSWLGKAQGKGRGCNTIPMSADKQDKIIRKAVNQRRTKGERRTTRGEGGTLRYPSPSQKDIDAALNPIY